MRKICGQRQHPPTQKSEKYVLMFKVLMVFQLAIAVADIVAHSSFLRQGIFGLFFLFLIFNCFYKLSYDSVLIYGFASIFFSVIFLTYILTIIQQGKTAADFQDSWKIYYLAVACASFVFYIFNCVFLFYPYRQFKMIKYMGNPYFSENKPNSASQQKIQSADGMYNNNAKYQINNPEADKQIKITVDNGNFEGKSKNKSSKTSFQVFKGQGVRIG